MKLGTENLTEDVCMVITDQWKPEWEKGIQVPNEKFISKPNFCSNTSYLDTAELEGINIFFDWFESNSHQI